jgi:hypothetical protein
MISLLRLIGGVVVFVPCDMKYRCLVAVLGSNCNNESLPRFSDLSPMHPIYHFHFQLMIKPRMVSISVILGNLVCDTSECATKRCRLRFESINQKIFLEGHRTGRMVQGFLPARHAEKLGCG